ncbi:cell division protein ZapA [Adhaeribacter aerolatus]|uniref:Cell division protein ZapA n=1 Tax=Adhaeribacter aerolatus TaxID=670289 RepID=A0A512B412_9BACT|nr:cell division protein ZapA [Adhaeribacter aerolatus]GEO06690.1 cell division protein ZapA [Adhaeribacter aerolatus]
MSELSIKIRIADRDYPMRVTEEEEERLRIAGRMLNERLKLFREQFGIDDKQDLLAMVALEVAADSLHTVRNDESKKSILSEKLSRLDQLLSSLKVD